MYALHWRIGPLIRLMPDIIGILGTYIVLGRYVDR